jgi:hypothetical protein
MMIRPKSEAPLAINACRCFRIDRLYFQKEQNAFT